MHECIGLLQKATELNRKVTINLVSSQVVLQIMITTYFRPNLFI